MQKSALIDNHEIVGKSKFETLWAIMVRRKMYKLVAPRQLTDFFAQIYKMHPRTHLNFCEFINDNPEFRAQKKIR